MNVKKSKIVRVTPVGVEKTYNMTMRAPHHNYFVNGLLSANSHSVAYAHVAYQTAYLKANYPEHFYAAVMTYCVDDAAKIFKYASELRTQGIKMLPPDVNESGSGFTPVEGAIRFGLSAIKGLGQSAVSAIIEGRASMPYTSVFDFAERVGEKGAGKRVLESLVCAGAFDSMKPLAETLHRWRACLLATVDRAMESGARSRRERSSGQVDMFGFVAGSGHVGAHEEHTPLVASEPWQHKELLTREKAAVGFYVSGHPMQDYLEKIEKLGCATVADLNGAAADARLRLAGVISDFTVRNTKKGDRYAFFRLEDMSGASVKCVLWPEAFKSKGQDAANDRIILAVGRLDGTSESTLTLVCDEVSLLEEARIPTNVPMQGFRSGNTSGRALVIELPSGPDLAAVGEAVVQALASNPGDCDVFLEMRLQNEGLLVRAKTAGFIKVFPSQRLQDALASTGVRVRWTDMGPAN